VNVRADGVEQVVTVRLEPWRAEKLRVEDV
jgi:hypothetical protein